MTAERTKTPVTEPHNVTILDWEDLENISRFGKCSTHDGLVLCGDFNDTPNRPRRTRLRIMSGLCLASQMLRLIEAQWNRSITGAIDLGLQITALITYFSPRMHYHVLVCPSCLEMSLCHLGQPCLTTEG